MATINPEAWSRHGVRAALSSVIPTMWSPPETLTWRGKQPLDSPPTFCRASTSRVCCASPPTKSFHPTYKPTAVRHTMKVTIREWNAVAAWRWDMPDDDVCGICRNPYDSTCSKCKFPGDECPLRKSQVDGTLEISPNTTQYSESATTPSTWYVTLPLAMPRHPADSNSALHLLVAQARELSGEVPYVSTA
jgi:hypothetical protein